MITVMMLLLSLLTGNSSYAETVLTTCVTEDSSNCVWDDGTGRAFFDLDGKTFYIN